METNVFDFLIFAFGVMPFLASLVLIALPHLSRAEKLYNQVKLLRFKYNIPKSELPAYEETPLLFWRKKKKEKEDNEQ